MALELLHLGEVILIGVKISFEVGSLFFRILGYRIRTAKRNSRWNVFDEREAPPDSAEPVDPARCIPEWVAGIVGFPLWFGPLAYVIYWLIFENV